MNEKDRIIYIMEQKKLSPSQFADAIGIQRAAMSHITSGRNNPSLDVLKKILEEYPHISPDWLLFGTGTMNRDDESMNPSYQEQKNMPDLFGNLSHPHEKKDESHENRNDFTLSAPANEKKQPVKEVIIPNAPVQVREVQKIMIFYSDDTYQSFMPEKK